MHWHEKVAKIIPPQPWKATKDWAEKRMKLETELCGLLRKRDIPYVLPWRRTTSLHRNIGNTNKVLFIELISHHINEIAVLEIEDDERKGFLGITKIDVSAHNRAAFDAGFIPSVDAKRRRESGAQVKTLIKIWHSAGFVERVEEGGALSYRFDQATFDRMRGQAKRAEEKRRAGRSPPHPAAHPVAGPVGPADDSLPRLAEAVGQPIADPTPAGAAERGDGGWRPPARCGGLDPLIAALREAAAAPAAAGGGASQGRSGKRKSAEASEGGSDLHDGASKAARRGAAPAEQSAFPMELEEAVAAAEAAEREARLADAKAACAAAEARLAAARAKEAAARVRELAAAARLAAAAPAEGPAAAVHVACLIVAGPGLALSAEPALVGVAG